MLDASVTLAWLLPDEGSDGAQQILLSLERDEAHAPALWPFEVANALLTARRRDRLADRDVDRLLDIVAALPVELDAEPTHHSLAEVVSLAREHRLTTYDAAYVELARRRRLPLATLDTRLAEACRKAGVAVLP